MKFCFILILVTCTFRATTQVVIARNARENGILIRGYDNDIELAVSGKQHKNITVEVTDGVIRKSGQGEYIWKVCDPSKERVYMYVYHRKKLLSTQTFRVMPEYDHNIVIRGRPALNVIDTVETFWRYHYGLETCLRSFVFETNCPDVIGFNVLITRSDSSFIQFSNKGAAYSPELQSAISDLKPGDRVTYSDFELRYGCEPLTRKYQIRYSVYME